MAKPDKASKKAAAKAVVAGRMADKAGAYEAMAEDVDGIQARAAFVKAQYDALIAAGVSEAVAVAALTGVIEMK